MEEDAEKRRERLREMRAMASKAEASVGNPSIASDPLANPFLDAPATDSFAPQRFGFYTDPMAAFSGNNAKKENVAAHQVNQGYSSNPSNFANRTGQIIPNVALPPAHEMHSAYPQAHHAQGTYYNSAPYRNPPGGTTPSPLYQGAPDNGPSTPSSYYSSSPGRGIDCNLPQQWTPTSYGRGRPWQQGNITYSSPGPGFGAQTQQWYGGAPQPGFRGGRQGRGQGRFQGRVFQSRGTSSDDGLGPECFYDRSMMEDPWQHLKPVLWKPIFANNNRSGSSKSWLPQSISSKKAKLSEPSSKSSSQQSLAEYLSASFSEALEDSPNV